MKITKIETFLHFSVWRNLILIRIETDEGIYGTGEATIKNKELAVVEAIDSHIAPYLIGQNPYCVSKLFNRFFTTDGWRGGAVFLSAVSGLEIALWDIIGKHTCQPIYNLLGGKVHPKLRVYANRWFDHCNNSADYAQAAKDTVNSGFTALKWDPLKLYPIYAREFEMVNKALSNIYDVRAAVGEDIDLCIELHGQLSYDASLLLAREVEKANVLFIEEPMHPDDTDGFRKLVEHSLVPIAAGERIFTRFQYKELLKKRYLSIVQPDLTHTGGIYETKMIGALAEPFGIKIAPHNSSGVIATMAAAMVDATMPNFLIQEMLTEVLTINETITKEKMNLKDGYIILEDKPGHGIELDWDAVKAVGYKPAFQERPR